MKTYDEYKAVVDRHLTDALPEMDKRASRLREAMTYSLEAGGKRLRPVLLLASCELSGGRIDDALVYALALEYIHTMSLIHDDLPAMDDDDYRRGRKTNHKVFGEGMAVLAGDSLLTSAFEAMLFDIAKCGDETGLMKKKTRAAMRIAKACGACGMMAGQASDILSSIETPDAEMIDYIDRNKTAMMINGAVLAGLELGDPSEEMRNALDGYSLHLGMAFQIADDILDATASKEETGKDTGKDEDNDVLNYVTAYGLPESRKRLGEHVETAVSLVGPYDRDGFFTDLVRQLEKRTK